MKKLLKLWSTWYPFQSEFWGGTPGVGESTTGTKGEFSFIALGGDQDVTDDWEAPNETDPPLPNPEEGSPPATAVGSGWLNLQFAPYLQEPVRM